MVGELSRELFASGKRALFLTTDVANPTSNSIYQRIGFRPVADHFQFEFVAQPE
jgi:predicted GNAT family acetyltransferase